MRRIMADARNRLEFNWSDSPQAEDPGGWYSQGEFAGEDFVRYSDVEIIGPGSLAPPVAARRLVKYTRNGDAALDSNVVAWFNFGTYNDPHSGPWVTTIPEGADLTGKVNVSVYVRFERDVSVVLAQQFLFEPTAVEAPPVAVVANAWVRVAHTFNTVDGDNRDWVVQVTAHPTTGTASEGDVGYATAALFWNADAVVPYFDGTTSPMGWWGVRAGRDVPEPHNGNRPGQTISVRYTTI